MTRVGKIARLPFPIREQLNQRLQNNEPGPSILLWLNGLPKVRSVLKTQFEGRPVSPANLTHWRQGGYTDWLAHRQALAAVAESDATADGIHRASHSQLADHVTTCTLAQIALALQQLASDTGDPQKRSRRLFRLCSDLVALRRSDHYAQRLKLEHDKINLVERKARLELRRKEFKDSHGRGVPKEFFEFFEREYLGMTHDSAGNIIVPPVARSSTARSHVPCASDLEVSSTASPTPERASISLPDNDDPAAMPDSPPSSTPDPTPPLPPLPADDPSAKDQKKNPPPRIYAMVI